MSLSNHDKISQSKTLVKEAHMKLQPRMTIITTQAKKFSPLTHIGIFPNT